MSKLGKHGARVAAAVALTVLAGAGAMAQSTGSWTGFYVGAHGGWANSKTTESDVTGTGSITIRGGAGGAHLGYNWQMQGLIVGVELDASALGGKKEEQDGVGTATFEQDTVASARLRVGFSPMPNLLAYATAGIGHTTLKLSYREPGLSVSASGSSTGFVGGGGLEFRISNALSLRGEALYYSVSDLDLKFGGIGVAKLDNATTVVRAGITFHVN